MEDFEMLFRTLNHEQRIDFAKAVFGPIGRYCNDNRQYYIDIWHLAEQAGFNLVITDYNSPVPTKEEIDKIAARKYLIDPTLLGFDTEAQKELFLQLSSYQDEMVGIPFASDDRNEFVWSNGMFPIADACTYYSLIRQGKPHKIVEVGSGQSTHIALKALQKNGHGDIFCIEPNPNQWFNTHLSAIASSNYSLVVDELQNLPLSFFSELQRNDILFIDSSHVVKAQSDLVYFFFSILSALAEGVMIHIHDIFLPYDYPLDFFTVHKRFHTEEYVLAAFLQYNRKFQTIFSNYYFLWQEYEFFLKVMGPLLGNIERSAMQSGEAFNCNELFVVSEMPLRPHLMGGSYWMRS
jgi:predicted O-methyltransferase YrrM